MRTTPTGVRRHLFLDLEDTIIEPIENNSWITVNLCKHFARVKAHIQAWKPDELHLFSFAVWNEHERSGFNKWTREWLERELQMPFTRIPRVDEDIIPNAIAVRCPGMTHVTFREMSDFWGKEETFRFNCRTWFADTWKEEGLETEVQLIDDCVVNETWRFPDLHLSGGTIDVARL